MKRLVLLVAMMSFSPLAFSAVGQKCAPDSFDVKLSLNQQNKYAVCICGEKKLSTVVANTMTKEKLTESIKKRLNDVCSGDMQVVVNDASVDKIVEKSSDGNAVFIGSDYPLNHISNMTTQTEYAKKGKQYSVDQYNQRVKSINDGTLNANDYSDQLEGRSARQFKRNSSSLEKLNAEKTKLEEELQVGLTKKVTCQKCGSADGYPLYIKDGDKYVVNPKVKALTKDQLLAPWTQKDIKQAEANVEDYNDVKVAIVEKNKEASNIVGNAALEDAGKDLKNSQEFLNNSESELGNAYTDQFKTVYEKYVTECADYKKCKANPSSDPQKCPNIPIDANSDYPPVHVDEGGNKLSLRDDKGEERQPRDCDDWAQNQAHNDQDMVAARKQMQEDDHNQSKDVSGGGGDPQQNDEKGKEEIAKLETFGLDSCGRNVFDRYQEAIVKAGHASAVDSNSEDGSIPRAIVNPLQCMPQGQDSGYFKMEGYQLFTNFDQDPVQNFDKRGKQNICIGMAYYYSDDSEFMCNNYLEQATQCPSKKDGSITADEKAKFDKNPDEDFKLKFASQETCKAYNWNKFRQCMGLPYKEINHTLNMVTGSNKSAAEKAADPKFKQRAKMAQISEINRQFGSCLAFRELSRKAAEEHGAWESGEEVVSIDGQYQCVRVTPWTQDYSACRHLVRTYNSFIAGDQVRAVAGQGWSMVENHKIQKEATEKMSKGDQINASLDAQRKSYKHQRDKERANLVFFSAQAGTLTAMLSAYPTPNGFSRKCDESEFACTRALRSMRESEQVMDHMFPNQDARKQMWGKVMEASASAVLAALKQAQFNKMAKDVGTYQEALNGLQKEATTSESTLNIGYCKLNPLAAGCQNRGPRVQGNSAFSYGGVGMQGGGGDYNVQNGNANFGEFDNENALTPEQKNAIADLGSVIDQDSAGSFDNSYDKIGAGQFTQGVSGGGGSNSAGGGGGGGGGGGLAGGSAGGGAGGENNAFGAGQRVRYGAGAKGVGYKAGSGGSDNKKSDNPFSNLFGKSADRKVASQVENDIAPSHSGLFDKISKRYSQIQASDRLLKIK